MTSALPEDMRERLEKMVVVVDTKDGKRRGANLAPQTIIAITALIEETDRKAREDCKSMVSKALYTEGVSVELASRVLANYENRFVLQSPSKESS